MPSRIVIRGHGNASTADWTRGVDWRQGRPVGLASNPEARPPVPHGFAAPSRVVQPFRDGTPWTDPETGLVYRVLPRLDGPEGWATTGFWQGRWSIDHGGVLLLAREGLLDAALESGTAIRKYRARDERITLASEPMARIRARLARARTPQEPKREALARVSQPPVMPPPMPGPGLVMSHVGGGVVLPPIEGPRRVFR